MTAGRNAEKRYEIKLVADGVPLPVLETWMRLHPAGFCTSYPPRQVNNVYFDTLDFASVEDNLAGLSQRQKLRIRWYGRHAGVVNGTWELKCRRAGVGWKESWPIGATIDLESLTWREVQALLLTGAGGPFRILLARELCPTLINRYQRRYYESWDRSIRATLDYDQVFYDQRLSSRPNVTRALPAPESVTLEFKASPKSYDRLVDAVQFLPLRVDKNSKYVSGVLRAAGLSSGPAYSRVE